uniref:Uncharacterized protein n=1 Tax=Anguilla anguilla TaxID=7936 RepID=A0A0E9VX65_ANGAN
MFTFSDCFFSIIFFFCYPHALSAHLHKLLG